jgi:hypothetical protein
MRSISRTARWLSVIEELPDELAEHIPQTDPVEEKSKVMKQLRLVSDFGVDGAEAVEAYIEGQISEAELESELESNGFERTDHMDTAKELQSEVAREKV